MNLTTQEAAVLEAILAFKVVHSFAPTVRELAEACGVSSPATIHRHLDALEDKGYITRTPSKPRTIRVERTADASVHDRPPHAPSPAP